MAVGRAIDNVKESRRIGFWYGSSNTNEFVRAFDEDFFTILSSLLLCYEA